MRPSNPPLFCVPPRRGAIAFPWSLPPPIRNALIRALRLRQKRPLDACLHKSVKYPSSSVSVAFAGVLKSLWTEPYTVGATTGWVTSPFILVGCAARLAWYTDWLCGLACVFHLFIYSFPISALPFRNAPHNPSFPCLPFSLATCSVFCEPKVAVQLPAEEGRLEGKAERGGYWVAGRRAM